VDEAVSDDGEAELLVELVQRLHLVHRNCHTTTSATFLFSCMQRKTDAIKKQELGNACLQQVWEARTTGSS
jgi:hypothetical protein